MAKYKQKYSGFMAVCPTDEKLYLASFAFSEEEVKNRFSTLTRSMYQWKDYEDKGWYIEAVELAKK